jgi:hypothetical protein
VQKLEDLDVAIVNREVHALQYILHVSRLFSLICCRQPRCLQLCFQMLERALKNKKQMQQHMSNEDEAKVLCELGNICIMQGSKTSIERAMKFFREATKKNSNNLKALEGMIWCQLCEGFFFTFVFVIYLFILIIIFIQKERLKMPRVKSSWCN